MTTLYYLSSIILIVYELKWILAPVSETNKRMKFNKLRKENEDKKWSEQSPLYKAEVFLLLPKFYILIWLIVGLFTSQWIIFLAILAFNIFIVGPLSKLTQYNFLYTLIHWINSVIGLCFVLFVIINKYHLNIDLTNLFLDIIK